MSMVIEWVVVGQLQVFLDKADCSDPFQSGFRLNLVDDLHWEMDRRSASVDSPIPSIMVSFWTTFLSWNGLEL